LGLMRWHVPCDKQTAQRSVSDLKGRAWVCVRAYDFVCENIRVDVGRVALVTG